MIKFLINLLVSAVAVFITAYLLSGVTVDSFVTAILVALVLGIINAFIRPVVVFLTLPINIITLGLFTLVINAGLVLLAAYFVSGFEVASLLWALAFSIVLTIVGGILEAIVPGE